MNREEMFLEIIRIKKRADELDAEFRVRINKELSGENLARLDDIETEMRELLVKAKAIDQEVRTLVDDINMIQ